MDVIKAINALLKKQNQPKNDPENLHDDLAIECTYYFLSYKNLKAEELCRVTYCWYKTESYYQQYH